MDWDVLEPRLTTHRHECLERLSQPNLSERESDYLRGELAMIETIKRWKDKPVHIPPRRYA